ncbi:MAG: hypothetical protein U5L07_08820 [Desulfobacterales bacterium]|nr:hypothetical protein [Desulfobacterales bacterium]
MKEKLEAQAKTELKPEKEQKAKVERDEKVAKYWLDPPRLQNSRGFNRLELKQLLLIIKENHPGEVKIL